jgi:hypothetical protein
VFHCTAGKDRTGLLAALLLSAIGVRREHVLADYALTAAGIERMRVWATNSSPDAAQRLAATPGTATGADALLSLTLLVVALGVGLWVMHRLSRALLARRAATPRPGHQGTRR